jgi:hypothetical protein
VEIKKALLRRRETISRFETNHTLAMKLGAVWVALDAAGCGRVPGVVPGVVLGEIFVLTERPP